MSILDAFNRNYQSYTDQVYGPGGYYTTSPSRMDYNIDANRAATELISNTLQQGLGSFGTPAAAIAELVAPAIAFGASPFHDITQAAQRAKESYDMPTGYGRIYDYMETPVGPTMSEFAKAVAAEQIPSTMIQRAMGAAVPLSNRIQTGLDLVGNFGFGTPAAASEVSIGESKNIEDFLETSTPTEISIPEAPKVFSPAQEFNFLPSAYEDETLGEDIGSTKPKFGIENLLETALGFAVPGFSILQNIAGGGQPYEQFTPGGTIRNGIYSIDGVNVPVSSFGGDFYNPNTGLNRFDRAKNRFNETRSLKDLFGASRTLAEFNNARKILETQKKTGYKSDFMNRPKSERNYTGPGGGDNTGGDIGAKGAADSFSNKSGMGRTGY